MTYVSPYLLHKPRTVDDVIRQRKERQFKELLAYEHALARQHARQDAIQERWNKTREGGDV